MTTAAASNHRRIQRRLYKLGWTSGKNTGTIRHRIHDLAKPLPWWDWGHRLMVLVGQYRTGSWDEPRVRDMWFYRTGDRRRPFVTTRAYEAVRSQPEREWRIFDSQDDGWTVVIGWYPRPDGDGRIHRDGLDGRDEQRLFLRWMVWDGLIKAEWFGFRRWLWLRGLHRAVQIKRPFTCQAIPARDSGGYSHWFCELRKRHDGPHRVQNYTWSDDGTHVHYAPIGQP